MRDMHRLWRIGRLAGAVILAVGAVLATGTSEASAANPLTGQWCWDSTGNGGWVCLNAWNGGPQVNVSTNANTRNNDFALIVNSSGYNELQFVGGGNYSGYCIGDLNNQSGQASAGLVPCGNDGVNQAGWGTSLQGTQNGCFAGQAAFKDVHWKGWIGPPSGWSNGSHFYLNKPGFFCFDELDPA